MSPRRRIPDRWPWPHESTLERREHLGRLYRDALFESDPERCLELDADAQRFGQAWIVPQAAIHDRDDLLTAELLADWQGVQPRTIDLWVSRGLKVTPTPDGNRFRVADVNEFQAARRRRRAAKTMAAAGGIADVPSSP
jgi:hypothetical protein